jgi:hypothetical protein
MRMSARSRASLSEPVTKRLILTTSAGRRLLRRTTIVSLRPAPAGEQIGAVPGVSLVYVTSPFASALYLLPEPTWKLAPGSIFS